MSWDVVETLADQLHKRVLLSQLFTEWLDVVCPTLHLRSSHKATRIVRVWVVRRKEGTWEYLKGKWFVIMITYTNYSTMFNALLLV